MNSEKTDKLLNDSINYFNTYGIPNYCRVKKIINPQKIISKEMKRLGIKNQNVTLEQMGLQTITKHENLYNKMQNREIMITSICSDSLRKITLGIKSSMKQTIEIEAGTLLFPDQKISETHQSLIVRDDISTTVSEGYNELDIDTFCFNQELRPPGKEKYSLGNIKSINFEKGMSQSQVWNITSKQKKVLQQLQNCQQQVKSSKSLPNPAFQSRQ